jgi:hypothetical protein
VRRHRQIIIANLDLPRARSPGLEAMDQLSQIVTASPDHGGGKRRGDGPSITTPILGLAQEPAKDPVARREQQIGWSAKL